MTITSYSSSRVDIRALIAVLLGVALGSLDMSIANTALPIIAADLNSSPASSIWVVNAYQLTVVASLFPLSALSDRVGPRKVFLWGIFIFTCSSFLCFLATDLRMLLISRAIQGFGAAGVMSVNLALIRLIFPSVHLGRGVGFNALVVGVSSALGPTVASLVLSFTSWPWLFAISIPFGILTFSFGFLALPTTSLKKHYFDFLNALLTSACFGVFVFAISSTAQMNSSFIFIFSCFLFSFFCGLAVIRRQANHPSPIFPVDLFQNRMFSLSALTAFFSFTTQGLAFIALPFYFLEILFRTPIEVGYLMTAWPAFVAIMAPLAGHLSDRYAPGLLGGIGLILLSLGLLFLSFVTPFTPVFFIIFCMSLCGVGFGFYQSPNLKALISSAPSNRSGGASGVIAMSRLLGQTTGAAGVALCFGLSGGLGSTLALYVSVFTSLLAAFFSISRIRVLDKT